MPELNWKLLIKKRAGVTQGQARRISLGLPIPLR